MSDVVQPRLTAAVDQARAEITDLVVRARAHAATNCQLAGLQSCIGSEVFDHIESQDPYRVRALLATALAELAFHQPAPPPNQPS